jgi:glycosyltransferase involved in cell wall biosynthesis
MDLLANELWNRGAHLTWWSVAFEHKSKRLSMPKGYRYLEKPGYEVILTQASGYRRNISVGRLRFNRRTADEFVRLASREPPPDLILTSYPTIELVGAIGRFSKRHGIPAVADVRDLWPDIWVDAAPSRLRRPATMLLAGYFAASRSSLASMAAITGITEEFVDWGVQRAGRVPSRFDRAFPFGYLSPALSVEQIHEAKQFWQTRLKCREYSPAIRLCFIGSIGLRTGLHHVIEAVLDLPASVRTKVQLVICGDDLQGQLLELKQRIGDNPTVVIAGHVDQGKLMALMEMSDLGVVPFPNTVDFQNSLSNKAPEYLAGGLGIVTGLQGKLRRLINENQCGYTYENQDTESLKSLIGEILGDQAGLEGRKQAARRLFHAEFQAEDIYARFADHLYEIAEQSKGTANRH